MDGSRQERPRIESIKRLSEDTYTVTIIHPDGSREEIEVRIDEEGFIETPYGTYHVDDVEALESILQSTVPSSGTVEDWATLFLPDAGELRSKISMKIVEVCKKPGEEAGEGERLLVFETMKMLGEVKSPCRARILEVYVSPGQGVKPGAPLIHLACMKR